MVKVVSAFETRFGTLAHTFDACKALELQELETRRICICCGRNTATEESTICAECQDKLKTIMDRS
jgi:hypothetical protein